MWQKLGAWILRFRLPLLILLGIFTGIMAYFGSKVELSYDFAKAIPVDNPKYQAYLSFKEKFGEDGNLLTIGFVSDSLFQLEHYRRFARLHRDMRQLEAVEDVISVHAAMNLVKDDSTEKLLPVRIFPDSLTDQAMLDSCSSAFLNLPFYRGLMYNPETHAYLMGVRVNKQAINSKMRDRVVTAIEQRALAYGAESGLRIHLSGLPLIRNSLATRIAEEMKWFLAGSILFSAIILILFFRSVSTTLLSLAVVIIGVIWSLGTMYLFGYRITILNGLIPPLIVVIGIPNCIYFLNKYHTSYIHRTDKRSALVDMVGRMGVVTLFCNISAAIGFAVFALTKSAVLQEFGIVAGINIMALFLISLILIPGVLSFLPVPKTRHTRYLQNRWLTNILTRIEHWVFLHPKTIFTITALVVLFSIMGIMRLRSEGFIVDDLPKEDRIYVDLKFFEKHFEGIMPLEILIDTKRKYGFSGGRSLPIFEKMDSFSRFVASSPDMARPLSLAEGLKFAKQAFYEGDSNNYSIPNAFDGAFVAEYLKTRKDADTSRNTFQQLMNAFMDSNRQVSRISVNMADVGSKRLPGLLDTLQQVAGTYFDTSRYTLTFTGTTVTFLEGTRYIINGLRESILWAFLLISLCMLYLFRSFRILICSLIPNLVPLLLTAGIMGWTDVALKPSTVLVFSVALGIAIDVTIRFLVNYKQELPQYDYNVKKTVLSTIRQTGISIIYTSLVLIAGFIIFVFSGFGGTKALGWLTSLTLLAATLTNLVLLPVLLLTFANKKQSVGKKAS